MLPLLHNILYPADKKEPTQTLSLKHLLIFLSEVL